jgi:hypothetical protein
MTKPRGPLLPAMSPRKDEVSVATMMRRVEEGPPFSFCRFWSFAELRFSLVLTRRPHLSPECACLSCSPSASPLFLSSHCVASGSHIHPLSWVSPASWSLLKELSMCLPYMCLILAFIPPIVLPRKPSGTDLQAGFFPFSLQTNLTGLHLLP